jgi:hypothetical protein
MVEYSGKTKSNWEYFAGDTLLLRLKWHLDSLVHKEKRKPQIQEAKSK